MYGSGQQGTQPLQPAGVDIVVEAGREWEIQEIGFDGVEKYIKPLDYSDHVAKLARKVDWRKLIGSDATFDDPKALSRESDEESEEEPETVVLGLDDRKPPEAGPWHMVARSLHDALQQVNLLMDTISVLKTSYLEPLTVADTFELQHNMQEVVQQSKQFQWVTKRKALSEAVSVLEQAQRLRAKLFVETDIGKEMFFSELKKMREIWRVRKTGNYTYGDLGYRIFGTKYNPKELFDIIRRPAAISSDGASTSSQVQSCLQVRVPCDLIRRSFIAVSIEIDDNDSKNLFATSEHDLDYMKVDQNKVSSVHWAKALHWAQESLISRDIFKQLNRDAILLTDRIAVVRDNVLIISLFDNILLRFELSFQPFEDGPAQTGGDDYLNKALRQLFVRDQCTREIKYQTFVTMPLTVLPDSLHLRGPYAMTNEEIAARNCKKRSLLERMISIASHFVLVNRVSTSLKRYLLQVSDPQIMWKWMRCNAIQSSVIVTAANRNYDYAGKTTFYVRVSTENFHVTTKEGQYIDCRRDESMFMRTLDILICGYMLNTVTMISYKLWQWQVLHANINAVDEDGEPAPTVYISNQSATRALFMQFHLRKTPTIRLQKCTPGKTPAAHKTEDFILLNYNRLIGSSLCRKVDNLCAMLKN